MHEKGKRLFLRPNPGAYCHGFYKQTGCAFERMRNVNSGHLKVSNFSALLFIGQI